MIKQQALLVHFIVVCVLWVNCVCVSVCVCYWGLYSGPPFARYAIFHLNHAITPFAFRWCLAFFAPV
jgi:hypothetical protein